MPPLKSKRGGLLDSWLSSRRALYSQLCGQVKKLLGKESPGMAGYRRSFEAEFPETYQVVDHRELIRAATQKKVVMVADFHCLKNTQKNQLKILKELSKRKRKKLVLAVEFFEAKNQVYLDEYLSGLIEEEEFLKLIRWSKRWGFPWENYRPIVHYARDHQIPILGLNRYFSERSSKTLKERDRFSAKILAEFVTHNPKALVMVIYGEQHLAQPHLPKEILSQSSLQPHDLLRVFQNHEKLFFDIIEKQGGHRVDVIQIADHSFCIQSLPPWVKWQSYLIYLEKESDGKPTHPSKLVADEDHLDDVARYLKILTHDFSMEVAEDDFEVYPIRFLARLLGRSRVLGGKAKEWAMYYSTLELSFYIPELGVAFLHKPAVNDFARISASIFVCERCHLRRGLCRGEPDFQRLVWFEGLVHFLTKMLNPKKKTKRVSDLYSQPFTSRSPGIESDSLKLALWQRAREVFAENREEFQVKAPRVKGRQAYLHAALILGGLLGERIFTLYRQGLLPVGKIKRLFSLSFENPDFDQAYEAWVRELESYPIEEVRPFF